MLTVHIRPKAYDLSKSSRIRMVTLTQQYNNQDQAFAVSEKGQ